MTKLLIVDDERIIREDLALNLPWRQTWHRTCPRREWTEAVEVIEGETGHRSGRYQYAGYGRAGVGGMAGGKS